MGFSWQVLLYLIILVVISNQIVFVNAQTLPSPLKQIESGIMAQDIKCSQGHVLIIKQSKGDPACVKPITATRLLLHGWITIEKFEITHPNLQRHNVERSITNYTSITSFNSTSVTNMTNNGASNVTAAYKLYLKLNNDNAVPHFSLYPDTVLPPLQVNYTESSTKPNSIKILFIGMYPNSLRVGETAHFSLTWQNISDKPIHRASGCTYSPLSLDVFPQDHMLIELARGLTCNVAFGSVYPNQIETDSLLSGKYQIMKAGPLNMTLTLHLSKDADAWDLIDTVKFNVNATQ